MRKNIFLYLFLLIAVVTVFLVVESSVVEAGCHCVTCPTSQTCLPCNPSPCPDGSSNWCQWIYGCDCISCGEDPDPDPDPDPCEPSCSGRECGQNSCGTGNCPDTCGIFKETCTSNDCVYYDASLTASASTPCINTTSASRIVRVSGNDNYCGDLTITASSSVWSETKTVSVGTASQNYAVSFNVPNAEIQRYVDTKAPATITVRGNRNTIKNSKDEETYDCDKTLSITYTFDNFYYCPTYGENEQLYTNSGFDFYEDSSYYVSTGSNSYFSWDECSSDALINTCSPDPTDCIDETGHSRDVNKSFDADDSEESVGEKEFEVCISKDGIQGGWTDADSGRSICNKITQKATTWYDCTRPSQCQYGENDFYEGLTNPKIHGLCCGDDYGEIPLRTKLTDEDGSDYYMPGLFRSCCTESFECVDKEGVCRNLGTSICLDEGQRGKCSYDGSEYYWNVTDDAECQKPCVICNINKEGDSAYQIDHFDLDSILTAIDSGSTELDTYDTNLDGVIDNGDYLYCQNFFGQPCSACIDGIFLPTEGCQENTETGEIEFHPDIDPALRCEDTISFIRDNTTCLPSCSANYSSRCVKGQCGASCATDFDCTGDINRHDYLCNQETCSCEAVGCPVGTTLCIDGTCSENCEETDTGAQGCINSNGECDAGEGCACEDCVNKRDSCMFGAICGENQLCVCPLGTSLCLDGTCSFDCTVTDTAAAGCIVENSVCEPGEGCGCVDCDRKQDSCILGGVCNFLTEQCELVCTKTENIEITINDGIDNDCDGLIDEPEFWPGYGVYVWESGCNYYMCVSGDDSRQHNTTGQLSVTGDYRIYRVKQYNWESDDTFAVTSDGKQVTFKSKLYNNIDCLLFKSDTMIKFDLTLDGSKITDKIYLTQNKYNPIENPFYFSSPECSQSCLSPGGCGQSSTFCGITGCGYERCLFDCGGYWVNGTAGAICTFLDPTSGDSCLACQQNMSCSNYTNIASCNFDPCNGAMTPFGCRWEAATGKCVDDFEYCMPGTTLCKDGTCSKDCKATDWKNAGCIGVANKKCEVGEGCACSDCDDKRDSCTFGAVCGGDELCGCPPGTTLCNDKTCDATCDSHGGKTGCNNQIANGICDFGEGCGCSDCGFNQDSCTLGSVCSFSQKLCVKPTPFECEEGTTLCKDFMCDETCTDHGGKQGCVDAPNGKCEAFEGCACEDCDTRRDSCEQGLRCDFTEKLCVGASDSSACSDSDNDGYFMKESSCSSGDDCDDTSSQINPRATEICNGIDDNCNSQIDENCLEIKLDVTFDVTQKARVLDTFKLKMRIMNQQSKAIENMKIILQAPERLKVKSNSATISLSPKEAKEVSFDVIIEDYSAEYALLTMKAQIGNEDIITKEIPLSIEIPEFAILVMPDSEQEDGNQKCYDFYYVLNKEEWGNYDIELDILDPAAIFGKSVVVDYVSNIEAEGKPLVLPMVSNPYCLPSGKQYEIGGYLYKEGVFGIVESIEENGLYLNT